MAGDNSEVKETKKSAKESKPSFSLVEVATQTAFVIKSEQTGEQFTIEQALVKLLNDVSEMKKGLVG